MANTTDIARAIQSGFKFSRGLQDRDDERRRQALDDAHRQKVRQRQDENYAYQLRMRDQAARDREEAIARAERATAIREEKHAAWQVNEALRAKARERAANAMGVGDIGKMMVAAGTPTESVAYQTPEALLEDPSERGQRFTPVDLMAQEAAQLEVAKRGIDQPLADLAKMRGATSKQRIGSQSDYAGQLGEYIDSVTQKALQDNQGAIARANMPSISTRSQMIGADRAPSYGEMLASRTISPEDYLQSIPRDQIDPSQAVPGGVANAIGDIVETPTTMSWVGPGGGVHNIPTGTTAMTGGNISPAGFDYATTVSAQPGGMYYEGTDALTQDPVAAEALSLIHI